MIEANSPSEQHKVRLLISYDGTDFCGWQSQLIHKNKMSVQAVIEAALTKIYKEPVHLIASGRTDAGVHATAQNANFVLNQDPRNKPLLLALRTLLPSTISVLRAWIVPMAFCANRSARAKTYRYCIYNESVPSAILNRFTYWYQNPLEILILQKYANELVGYQDFTSFQSAGGTPPKTSLRHIYKATWSRPKCNIIVFEITGNGFLKQMIRNLVSTQLKFYQEGLGVANFKDLMLQRDRRLVGKPAPAQGLFLSQVYYSKALLTGSILLGDFDKKVSK
jgi:tRNA pseudouridine38-40 synthase